MLLTLTHKCFTLQNMLQCERCLKAHSDYCDLAVNSDLCSALQLIGNFSIFTAMYCISCWLQQNHCGLMEPQKTNLLECMPVLQSENNCVCFFTDFSAEARSEKRKITLVHRFYALVVTFMDICFSLPRSIPAIAERRTRKIVGTHSSKKIFYGWSLKKYCPHGLSKIGQSGHTGLDCISKVEWKVSKE